MDENNLSKTASILGGELTNEIDDFLSPVRIRSLLLLVGIESLGILSWELRDKVIFLVKAGSGPRPRTKRVKNFCALSADYYNIN